MLECLRSSTRSLAGLVLPGHRSAPWLRSAERVGVARARGASTRWLWASPVQSSLAAPNGPAAGRPARRTADQGQLWLLQTGPMGAPSRKGDRRALSGRRDQGAARRLHSVHAAWKAGERHTVSSGGRQATGSRGSCARAVPSLLRSVYTGGAEVSQTASTCRAAVHSATAAMHARPALGQATQSTRSSARYGSGDSPIARGARRSALVASGAEGDVKRRACGPAVTCTSRVVQQCTYPFVPLRRTFDATPARPLSRLDLTPRPHAERILLEPDRAPPASRSRPRTSTLRAPGGQRRRRG